MNLTPFSINAPIANPFVYPPLQRWLNYTDKIQRDMGDVLCASDTDPSHFLSRHNGLIQNIGFEHESFLSFVSESFGLVESPFIVQWKYSQKQYSVCKNSVHTTIESHIKTPRN
jgi:hypothetical protein